MDAKSVQEDVRALADATGRPWRWAMVLVMGNDGRMVLEETVVPQGSTSSPCAPSATPPTHAADVPFQASR